MRDLPLIEIINIQIENINKAEQTREDMIMELAILKTFLISQNLHPEMEEFRNLIYMELS